MGFWNWLTGLFGKKTPPPVEQRTEQEIREKSERIRSFEGKIAELLGRKQELESKLGMARHEVRKWDTVIDAAVKLQADSSVLRDAVRQGMEAKQNAQQVAEECSAISKTIDGLKDQLRIANDKINMSEAKAANLTARLESAKIREELAGNTGPVKTMSELEEETYKAEGRAEAEEDMSKFHQDYVAKNSIHDSDVEAEVERLMGKKK